MALLVQWNVGLGGFVGIRIRHGVVWRQSYLWHTSAHEWQTQHSTLETATLTQTHSQEVSISVPPVPFFLLVKEERIQTSESTRSRWDACYQTVRLVMKCASCSCDFVVDSVESACSQVAVSSLEPPLDALLQLGLGIRNNIHLYLPDLRLTFSKQVKKNRTFLL